MSLQLGYGIRVAAAEPVDANRYIAVTLNDRNSLIGSGREYEGLLVYVKEDKKLYILKDPTAPIWEEVIGGGTPAPGGDLTYPVLQLSHGLSVGDIIADTGVGYSLASATDDTATAIGLIISVEDTDNFTFQDVGSSSYTRLLLNKGSIYYLSTTPGEVTDIEPADFKQIVFQAIGSSSVILNVEPMFVLGSPSGTGGLQKIVHIASGITNHNTLDGRSNADAHPINSVTGLQTELDEKEDGLGNPIADGYVLSSTTAGVRSWAKDIGEGFISIIQVAHGLSAGKFVGQSETGWVNATNIDINYVPCLGVVAVVVDADTFTLQTSGKIITGDIFSPNTGYYLGVGGDITSVYPNNIQFIASALNSNELLLVIGDMYVDDAETVEPGETNGFEMALEGALQG